LAFLAPCFRNIEEVLKRAVATTAASIDSDSGFVTLEDELKSRRGRSLA
jgi:hypothetical protein